MAYISGHHIEERLAVRLERAGCELTQSEELNHKYKIDFVITRFDGIAKMRPIGIQVTTRPADRDKMREFLLKQREYQYVDKALYVELQANDIDQGIDKLVYSAIVVFLFSSEYQNVPYMGLRVRPGFIIDLFDLDQEVARLASVANVANTPRPPSAKPAGGLELERAAVQPAVIVAADAASNGPTALRTGSIVELPRPVLTPRTAVLAPREEQSQGQDLPPGTALTGSITSFNVRGFGFIAAEVDHFFPISKVEDASLRAELEELQTQADPWVRDLDIKVRFVTQGRIRGPNSQPLADQVVRDPGSGDPA